MNDRELSPGARFMVINAVRVAGVAMVLVGILALRGVIDTIDWVGYILIVVGLFDIFVVPQIYARKWRTPPGEGPNAGIE